MYTSGKVTRKPLTQPEFVWEITKALFPDKIETQIAIARRFHMSDLKTRGAVSWLSKRKYIVRNGAMIALTEAGKAFHDRRREIRDD